VGVFGVLMLFCGGEGLARELKEFFTVASGIAKGEKVREAFSNCGGGSASFVLMELSERVNLARSIGNADGISAHAGRIGFGCSENTRAPIRPKAAAEKAQGCGREPMEAAGSVRFLNPIKAAKIMCGDLFGGGVYICCLKPGALC